MYLGMVFKIISGQLKQMKQVLVKLFSADRGAETRGGYIPINNLTVSP